MLDTAYADKVYDFVMGDLDENGWSLAAVPMQECITNMTEFPSHIVEHIFRLHGTPHMDNKVRRDCCFASFMCKLYLPQHFVVVVVACPLCALLQDYYSLSPELVARSRALRLLRVSRSKTVSRSVACRTSLVLVTVGMVLYTHSLGVGTCSLRCEPF